MAQRKAYFPSNNKCFNVGMGSPTSHTMQAFHVIHLKDLEILESQRFKFLEAKIPVSDGDPTAVLIANGDAVCVGVIQDNGNGVLRESNLVLLEHQFLQV